MFRHDGAMTIFQTITAEFGPYALYMAFAVMFLGGFVKGVVGFALPMITISGVGSFMSVDMAVLALLIPGLVSNLWQGLRAGILSARGLLVKYWRVFLILPVVLAVAAQVFTRMSETALFVLLGVIVCTFALLELTGFRGKLSGPTPKLEMVTAAASGITGGLSGVWGPPVMMYLMAKDIAKSEFVQTMGLVFLIGAIVLNLSHINSGLLNPVSAPFSALMLIPSLLGMWLGTRVQDRLDQTKFRRATLVVLLLAGMNLLRRGLM